MQKLSVRSRPAGKPTGLLAILIGIVLPICEFFHRFRFNTSKVNRKRPLVQLDYPQTNCVSVVQR